VHRFVIGEIGLPADRLALPAFLREYVRHSTLLFGMGRDSSTGIVTFDGSGLTTDISRSFDAAVYDEIDKAISSVARHYRPHRFMSPFLTRKDREGLLTVHPLGGCSIGRDVQEGFTDHRGEVFGHRGLFVADGSLYPRSPGIAPSMTIAALAERQASLIE
jgi:cholesterol oxidase